MINELSSKLLRLPFNVARKELRDYLSREDAKPLLLADYLLVDCFRNKKARQAAGHFIRLKREMTSYNLNPRLQLEQALYQYSAI